MSVMAKTRIDFDFMSALQMIWLEKKFSLVQNQYSFLICRDFFA